MHAEKKIIAQTRDFSFSSLLNNIENVAILGIILAMFLILKR